LPTELHLLFTVTSAADYRRVPECIFFIQYRYEAPNMPKRRSRMHPIFQLSKPGRVRGGFVGPRSISRIHLIHGSCRYFWLVCRHMLPTMHLSGRDGILSPENISSLFVFRGERDPETVTKFQIQLPVFGGAYAPYSGIALRPGSSRMGPGRFASPETHFLQAGA
jgi:hypothetical protein